MTERIPASGSGGGRSTRSGCPITGDRSGLAKGDAANELIGFVADPNVSIQESKASDRQHPTRRRKGQQPVLDWPSSRQDDGPPP